MKNKNDEFKNELETQYNILIQTEQKEQQKRTIAILIILSITLFTTIITLIFAYKSYQNTKNIRKMQTETQTHYQILSSIYNTSAKIEIPSITTGYFLENPKVITITNEGDIDINYNLKISSIKTSLSTNNNLVYNITENNEMSIDRALPLKDSIILENILIHPNETKTYTINIKFNGYIETSDISNYYNASIVVEETNNKSNLLN